MTPLERARDELWREFAQPPRTGEDLQARCDRAARAVLQAIREPSARQLRAGREALSNFDPVEGSAQQMAERIWQVMIDVALEEG